MPRFSDEAIQRLKEETEIVRLIESYGTRLKERGQGELIGLCPVHDDQEPSLVVNRKKGVWNCLGACGKGGDAIEWVMHAEKVGFRHAVELLKNGAVGSGGGKKFTTERKLDCPLVLDSDDVPLLTSVANYYHERIKESPPALEYLQSRGITDSEALEKFRIGFVDRTLGLRLPAGQLKAGKELRERLRNIGILRDTGHEHLRGCITFPLFNEQGRVVQIYGRRIDNGQGRAAKHFYLPGPQRGVLNRQALAVCDEVILCESILDALTFWSAGFRNVTTIYGTNGLTDEFLSALKQHEVKRLLIAFDNDDAGNAAVEKHAKAFESLGIERFRIKLPAGMDANEYALKVTPAAKSLELVIRKAEWIGGKAESGKRKAEERVPSAVSGQPSATKEESLLSLAAEPVTDETPAPAASPTPPAPQEIQAEVRDNEIFLSLGNRSYRVRGLEKNLAFDVLKVNVLARRDERFYIDTFDLYAARARSVFVKEAAQELGFDAEVIKRDLGKVLLKLEALQDAQIENTLAAKDEQPTLSDKDQQAALELLKQPNLIEQILSDFAACGVVGEETNKLVGYLAATSRKLDKPLAVVIQSSSAAGKSSLMDAILRFIPAEEQVGYSAMTGQSLFYMGGMQLAHKILSIAEEEGVAQASYALKLLQSEGELTIASTGKDPGTGRMETQEYHVEGPVMIFLTTTAIDIDEELLNRCVVLTVDENRRQTQAIHAQQRKNQTLDGLLASGGSSSVRKLHQNAQRLLRPLAVVNPFAGKLSFIDDCARRRRDHMKYLTLIQSIALLHQYQRELKSVAIDDHVIQYVEVIPSDIVLANRLADQILGNSIDELPPQTRRLLVEIYDWAQAECKRLKLEQREFHFTRRMLRESLGWNHTQLRLHLDRLTEMEYAMVHRGGRGSTMVYELLWDGRGREGQPTLCGLIDVAKLTNTTTNLTGSDRKLAGPKRPQSAHLADEESTETLVKTNGKLR